MDVMERFASCGLVPVVVIDDAGKAVEVARALLAGGVDVMEITLRTPAALESIKQVSSQCPDILVGAGTVLSVEQGKAATGAGARFIVSPGFDQNLVKWCLEVGVPVTPGCVTPTEIMMALTYGLKVLKFFPAHIYGGLTAMKSLASPFGQVSFIPTGGISNDNLEAFMGLPMIHAVGGSWICPRLDIQAGRYENITALCRSARSLTLGYEALLPVSIPRYEQVIGELRAVFGHAIKIVTASGQAKDREEALLAVRTHDLKRAMHDLASRGFRMDPATVTLNGDLVVTALLEKKLDGLAVQLIRK